MGPATGGRSGARVGEQASAGARWRRPLRGLLLAAIGVLYLISVPWYRDQTAPLALSFGLPDWVAFALACYIAVAVLNAVAWLLTDVPDDARAPDPAPETEESGRENRA